VSPLINWSGAKPPKKPFISLSSSDSLISKEPSVIYRGFFINDEWPAFGNWCSIHYGGFTAKMYENVQRDVLIALANQYSEYCRVEGLNIQEVTECASTKWNFAKVLPGLVGGHCISVDPYYLLARAKDKDTTLHLVETARSINEAKVEHVAKRIIDFAKQKYSNRVDLKILILGFSYKRNVGDIRNTKIAELLSLLSTAVKNIDCYDPLVNKEDAKNIYGLDVITSMSDIPKDEYDLAIVAVSHNCISEVRFNAKITINLEEFI
jgi:UDP-N-acetyl-D-galactosamine dehydrogenase